MGSCDRALYARILTLGWHSSPYNSNNIVGATFSEDACIDPGVKRRPKARSDSTA